MELVVLEEADNRVKFEVTGAGHTFCNNFKHALYADKNIKTAAYKVDHPLVSTPTFIIEKKGNTKFSTIIKNVADSIKDENKEFAQAVNNL